MFGVDDDPDIYMQERMRTEELLMGFPYGPLMQGRVRQRHCRKPEPDPTIRELLDGDSGVWYYMKYDKETRRVERVFPEDKAKKELTTLCSAMKGLMAKRRS